MGKQHIRSDEAIWKLNEVKGRLNDMKEKKTVGQLPKEAEEAELMELKSMMEPFRWHDWYRITWNSIWELQNMPSDGSIEDNGANQQADDDLLDYLDYSDGSDDEDTTGDADMGSDEVGSEEDSEGS